MTLSRREFLGSVAAIPIANAITIAAALPQSSSTPRVAVIGAGAFGGWTALHLRRLGAQVTLIDAWGPGHARASSGGETRVIRAVYGGNRTYAAMVRRAFELWAELDPSLYLETGALWMHRGDDAYTRSSVPALAEVGFAVEQLTLDAAAKRWPQIDFRDVKTVWLEKRAGALMARRACTVVRDALQKAGGSYRVGHVTWRDGAARLDDGTRLEADAYVFACGPWLGKLFAEVPIAPTRQEVYFFGTPRGSERYRATNFPVWVDFGERLFYGIPDVDGRGFKFADDTRGDAFDPTTGDRTPSAEGIARARRVLAERFPELANAPLIEARVCQYENSADGHFIIDRHPAHPNVWVAGGGSGHGFKLGPAVGEMVARRVLKDEAVPEMFRLGRFAALP